jgi:tRNA A-37 threonylcarbamoyl transferase component Bud32
VNERRETLEIRRTFTLLEPLGEGAMGEVFAAADSVTDQRFAVKLLRKELLDDERARAYFDEEARITAAVDHTGGTPVYGLGIAANGRPFYVMKRVEGQTLTALLEERRSRVDDLLWRERLLRIFGEVCETVAYAHARGIIHRDLKPGNVLVDERDGVTVIDWGLAKHLGRSGADTSTPPRTVFGDVLGSPGYMAPEQAAGESTHAARSADVFSLGAMLYEILTGANPFAGATPRESMLAAIHREPSDPRRSMRWHWHSHSFIAVCRKALEKEPKNRYADASELARDLRALSRGHPASGIRPSLGERIRWAGKRRPLLFAFGAALTVAITLAAVLILVQFQIDARLADKAFERVAERDQQIESLSRELRDLDRRWAAADNPNARRALAIERGNVEMRRFLEQLDSVYLLRDVMRLRFIRRDPRLIEMIKSRMFLGIEWAIDLEEPVLAKAILDELIAHQGEDWVVVSTLTRAERERLRRLVDEANRAYAKATKVDSP